MASGYKNPPKFHKEKYQSWRSELKIWQLVTDIRKTKQALAVTPSLTDKAKEVALNIQTRELNQESGLDILILALNEIYFKRIDRQRVRSVQKF